MKSSRVLIKLGGSFLKETANLDVVAETLKEYRKYEYQPIVVHGGGPSINEELTRRGIEWSFLDGQRVTSPAMMEVIESVLCGDINRRLVRHFVGHGIPAVGFSGADGNTLMCEAASPALGQVGAITEVSAHWIEGLLALQESILPVISPVGIGETGQAYNINADWAAAHLAVALKVKYLIFLTDQKGILDQEKSLIPNLSSEALHGLIQCGVVNGGMLTKVNAINHALKNGVSAVRVMDAREMNAGLWSNHVGTWCMSAEHTLDTLFPQPSYEVSHVAG